MTDDLQPLGRARLTHKRPASFDRFWFGAAYYPEHWDEATRSTDPERMAAAGFNLVRMGEFAWNILEPAEGQYEFALFDQTIRRLGAVGIHTMLCTPTAAPPRWLTLQHPEILRVNDNGVALEHGSRQHACHASPVFRDYSRKITQAMATHFQGNPLVVGWQTDNEFHCHFCECHCPNCQRAFAEFLRRKFDGDIRRLNENWGTAFWALTYREFAEITTPKPNKPTFVNPAHQLDYCRYLSDAVTRFQHDQVAILRAAQPRWWVTHNGLFASIDYRGLFTQDLDVLGNDCYPMFCLDPAARPASQAFTSDVARAWSGNFIVPEQQSGPGGQLPYCHDHPEPGEVRKMTYVSVARGADSLLYFRWRTCRFGAEEYWGGIFDHDNVPRRRYAEVMQVGAELRKLGPELRGTHVTVEAALAGADMVVAHAHSTYHLGLPASETVALGVHEILYRQGFAVGVIHPADDLAGVKLYIIPHWAVFDPAWVPALEQFVTAGGLLVIGARTATRDWNNNVVAATAPGCLRHLAGITVAEYGRQNAPEKRPLSLRLAGKKVPTTLWYEGLKLGSGTAALATWSGRHLGGQPAVSLRPLGRGAVIYVGTYLTAPVASALAPLWVTRAGLTPLWPGAPTGVEVVRRQSQARRLWFFINHNERPVTIKPPPRGANLLTGKPSGARLTLRPNDVAVIKTAGAPGRPG